MSLDRNYAKSNKIITVDFSPSAESLRLSAQLLEHTQAHTRERVSEALVDELCDLAQIDIVQVSILNEKQVHKRAGGKIVMRQYGYYKPATHQIVITNATAVRGAPLAPKTFADTLLHEWMHHYDTRKLKLNSIHTRGFYYRLKHLKTLLGI